MKELSTKEKAKAYDEAIERARQFSEHPLQEDSANIVEYIFPELRESEDKKVLEIIKHCIESRYLHTSTIKGISQKQCFAWLEKQGEQEQLYIRFGEIPTDEKSKIFQGEIEVGTENGVSVYPAFKTSEGNIVLGLSLPITKTTLYTQQHLIEYDDRPCYLVKGDYVGKDTDGQPLINNVSIIEKISSYRVKEKKQNKESNDRNEPKFKVGDWITDGEVVFHITSYHIDYGYQLETQKETLFHFSDENVESKYHLWTIEDAKDGDVLASELCDSIILFKGIKDNNIDFYCDYDFSEIDVPGNRFSINNRQHYGSVEDSKDFHPATKEQRYLLFQKMEENSYSWNAEEKRLMYWGAEPKSTTIDIDKMVDDYANNKEPGNEEFGRPVPCMVRAYRQGLNDAIHQNIPRYNIGDVLCDKSCTTLNKEEQPNFEIIDIRNGMYICDKCSFPISQQDEYELVAKRIEQKPIWSENEMKMLDNLITYLNGSKGLLEETKSIYTDLLKSLKERIKNA